MGIASSLARGTPRPVSSRLALAAKDEKGRVEIDYDKCIGCRFCMAACPYNARVFNWSEPDHDPDFQTGFKDVPVRPRGVMEKCTLCKERCDADSDNEPMCVVCCPSSARVYGDLDAPNSEISKIGQQISGLGITGMSSGTSWGLYICRFLLFVGLSAGGLIVASAGSVFHIEDYEKIALPAIATSLSCILVAGALVLVDLGGHARSR